VVKTSENLIHRSKYNAVNNIKPLAGILGIFIILLIFNSSYLNETPVLQWSV